VAFSEAQADFHHAVTHIVRLEYLEGKTEPD
jgi:hypothetical protein